MKIGIDVDNVIADTVPVLLLEINRYYKTDLRAEDIHIYDIHTLLGLSRAEMKPFWIKLYSERKILLCQVIPGAREGIEELRKRYKVYLVTSRFKEYEDDTKRWLKDMDIPYDWLEHVEEKKKHIFAKEKKISVFVEDDLEQAIYMAESGIKVFLFDRPWNRSCDVQRRLIRVKSWAEILEKL